MRRETKIALAVGIPVVVGVGAYLAYKTLVGMRRYLFISVGEGGTTIPAPGTYTYKMGENVTITAFPDEGYTVGTWVVDGVEVARQVGSITVTMDVNHNVIVTFWKGGVPPPSAPVLIMSLGSATVKSHIGAWFTGTPGVDQCCHVAHCDENWKPNGLVKVPMKFKVVDAAGVGVPGVDVALWTDPMPDSGRYRGWMYLDGTVHTYSNPIIKKTDGNGVVSVDVSYAYGLSDGFRQVCEDSGVGFQFGCAFLPCISWCPAQDGYRLGIMCYVCWTAGECETGKAGCERMGDWARNRVYAQIVGTALQTVEFAFCGFHVKWI
jgi:hypothetical protein